MVSESRSRERGRAWLAWCRLAFALAQLEASGMGDVVAVLARKGGTGKSTLCVSLGAASVYAKRPATVVDLDAQATVTSWAIGRPAMERLARSATVAGLVEGPAGVAAAQPVEAAGHPGSIAAAQLVESAAVPGLGIVPMSTSYRVVDARRIDLSGLPGVVIVDCPPDCGLPLVQSVLEQASLVVCPVQPEVWAAAAVPEVFGACRDVGRYDLADRLLVVVSMAQRCAIHQAMEKLMRDQWGERVAEQVLPRTVTVPEAFGTGSVVKRTSAYGKLVDGLWRRIEGELELIKRSAA